MKTSSVVSKGTSLKEVVFRVFGAKQTISFAFFVFGLVATLLEGLGIALFLPLLRASSAVGDSADAADGILKRIFDLLGLEVSLVNTLILIVLTFSLKGCFQFVQTALRVALASRFARDARAEFMSLLSRLDFRFFDGTEKSALAATLTSEVDASAFAVQFLLRATVKVLTALTLVALAFVANWRLMLLSMLIGAIAAYFLKSFSRKGALASQGISTQVISFNRSVSQTIGAFKYLRGTETFSFVRRRALRELEGIYAAQKQVGLYGAVLEGVQQPIASVILAASILISVNYLGSDLPSILVTLALIYKVLSQVMNLQNEWQSFSAGRGHLDSLFGHFERMRRFLEDKAAEKGLIYSKEIRLDDVSLDIGGRRVLSGLNMSVPCGAYVGIVGESGSGKSTIVDLLTGLRSPSGGRVCIDGVELNGDVRAGWRKRLGLVNQDFVLFEGSVFENVTLGSDHEDPASVERARQALQFAQALDFIPNQDLKVQLGVGSLQLSVGQRQRIAIAREIYKNPEIMILDEATSALDPASEALIQKALEKIAATMTLVVVTHRIPTLRNCGLIYVVAEGRVIESGSFDELMMRPGGRFRQLSESDKGRSDPRPRVRLDPEDHASFEIRDRDVQRSLRIRDISSVGVGLVDDDGALSAEVGSAIDGELLIAEGRWPCSLRLVHRRGNTLGAVFISMPPEAKAVVDKCVAIKTGVAAKGTL